LFVLLYLYNIPICIQFYFLAYGFGLIRGSIEIHATFMNQKIITPKIPVHQNELKITSDIIWYMNNASLKK